MAKIDPALDTNEEHELYGKFEDGANDKESDSARYRAEQRYARMDDEDTRDLY